MKKRTSLGLSLALCAPLPAWALLDKFTHPDGAISVVAKGGFVDPYFANKALIMAWEAGIDASAPTKRWLMWLVPRQRSDGGFDRFCSQATAWHACQRADADDSTAATFLHLSALYGAADKHKKRMHPKVDVHSESVVGLRTAMQRAQGLLQSLRTPRGTYRALVGQNVEYLMDNTELEQALDLKAAIQKHFYSPSTWQPANIAYDRYEFYPSALAPVYRWHTGLVNAVATDKEAQTWTQRWGPGWLTREHDEFAWGLVAWSARGTKNQDWIRCWRYRQSLPHNRSRGWTVIDEAADVGLATLGVRPSAKSCTAVLGKK
jgi:hypothetical protein